MLTVTGDTIYYDGKAVAWLTVPNGSLRQEVLDALDDLPDSQPLQDAMALVDQADTPAKVLHCTGALVETVRTWLDTHDDTGRLI